MADRIVRLITKRTAVPGKIPTGTTGTELNLIKTGELASNLADKKLFSYDGSNIFEFGSKSFLGLTGGTVSGETTFQSGITVNTISDTNYIDFNTAYVPTVQEGRLHWDVDYGTLDVDLEGNNVSLKVGLDNLYYIKNQSGSTINKGRVVRSAGTLGGSSRILGEYMIADGTIPHYFTLGIAGENILNGEDGYVYEFGLIRGVDTSGSLYGETWVDGTILYVSPTILGGLTSVEPTEPNLKIEMAIVIDAAVNGSLFVRPSLGYNLGDLHNLQTSGQTNGDLISYNSLLGYWEYTKTLNGNYTILGNTTQIGNFNITGNTNQVGNVILSGYSYQIGNNDLFGDFNVTGNTNQDGNFYITGLIEQIGDVYQVGNVFITGYTEQIGDVYLTGNTEQIGNFNITGNTTQDGNITQIGNYNVTGNTNQIGLFNISGHTTGCTLSVSGNTCITGDLDVAGDVFVVGNLVVTGSTTVQNGFTADTITISDTPNLNNNLTKILGRNETTGVVEYRSVNTIGNNYTYVSGATYSAITTDNVIGVDSSISATTIYLPDSITSGRLRYDIKDIGLNSFNNNITIVSTGSDTIISTENSNTIILGVDGGALIIFNTGSGIWLQM